MPTNSMLSREMWNRYSYMRDNGHLKFITKAKKCEDFFCGDQWASDDLALLRAQRRPALTINEIISTMSNVMGEQIFNRTDVMFRPRNEGATQQVAEALTKTFMQISDNNMLPWLRSDVFCDGIVSSRGFFDLRLDFTDNMQGEVRVEQLNPKNVLIDPDADDYDPDSWTDVMTTKWMTADQIEVLYSKRDADLLRGSNPVDFSLYGEDYLDRDRFGLPTSVYNAGGSVDMAALRTYRVLERQYRKLDKFLFFVNPQTGDMRPVPSSWTEEHVAQYLAENPGVSTLKRTAQRIRWTVSVGNVVLHDDWSPYKHFTVVPFFPHFLRGRTIGLVENLLGPQELLNKVSSQELHVVNTTANSGWKVKKGALKNMTIGELENRGAVTGLVLELENTEDAEKITPNQTPSGLDRISFKAKESIKSISAVTDYSKGDAREDVSAKAVRANQSAGSANFARITDNLARSDWMLARNTLDMIQEFYTEPRLIQVTTDRLTGQTQPMQVNQVSPEGEILNDLTLGEYATIISSQPDRDTFEDSQFDQIVSMRNELGVKIPDKYVIQSSKLRNKAEIMKEMEGDKDSPEAQAAAELQKRAAEAAVAVQEADAANKQADAQLKGAKTQESMQAAQQEPLTPDQQYQIEMEKLNQETALKREEMERKFALEKEAADRKYELEKEAAAHKARTEQVKNIQNSSTGG